MTSELHNENLLDLLYGELGPDEERALREEIAGDPDLAEEFAELSAAREAVQVHTSAPAEVPDAVTESILAAARQQAAALGSDRRHDGERPRPGVWTNFTAINPMRFGTVAAVLLASALLFLFMRADVQHSQVMDSSASTSGPVAQSVPAMEEETAEESLAPPFQEPAVTPPSEEVAQALEIDTQVIPDPAPAQSGARAPEPAQRERAGASRPAARRQAQEPAPRSLAPTRGGAFSSQERSSEGAMDIGSGASLGRSAPAPAPRQESASAPALSDDLLAEEAEDAVDGEVVAEGAASEEESLLDQAQRALEDGEVGQASRLLERILAGDDHSEEYQERAESLRRSISARQRREAARPAPEPSSVDVEAAEPSEAFPEIDVAR